MSRRNRKNRQHEPLRGDAAQNRTLCTDRAAHWERIFINGHCFKCMKELAPLGTTNH